MNILITGASGYIGSALISELSGSARYRCFAASRNSLNLPGDVSFRRLTGMADFDLLREAVQGIDVIVHTANIAHIFDRDNTELLRQLREVNVDGTLNLAKLAVESGVRRFVYLSSVKASGEKTKPGQPLKETDRSQPEDVYGETKLAAEKALLRLAQETDLEVVILRPPLVYGPGVKGNMCRLVTLLSKNYPLPLAGVHNKRSYVSLANLTDAIKCCLEHPEAANQVFFVADGNDLSTTELSRKIRRAMKKNELLFPVPSCILMFGARLLGQQESAGRLLGNLQVDVSKIARILGWHAPFAVDEGIERMLIKAKEDTGCH